MAAVTKPTLVSNAKLGGFASHDPDQEQATHEVLVELVDDGGLSGEQAVLLAYYAGELGVLGPLQAEYAAKTYADLSEEDRKAFDALLDAAGSDLERAFLFKALSAHPEEMEAVAGFAELIRGQSESWLLHNLTLSAARAVVDGFQNGVIQQFNDTCVPTSAQALKGELDPIYALSMRRSNTDISRAHDSDPKLAGNDVLQAEQLHGGGGAPRPPRPRSEKAANGGFSENQELLFNVRLPDLGFLFGEYRWVDGPVDAFWPAWPGDAEVPKHKNAALDEIAEQLERGIPVPFGLKNHKTLALAVDGEGSDQKFLIHDPFTGETGWLTREQVVSGNFDIAGWNAFQGYTPAIEPDDAEYAVQEERRDDLRAKIEDLP